MTPIDTSGRPRPNLAGRHGFTVVELIVAILIGAILMGSIYQVLVTNQRLALVQREQVLGQQTTRSGLDLLVQELREVSAGGGDLTAIENNRVEFRALRAFGVACQVVTGPPPLVTIANEGRPFVAGDSVYLFADGNPAIAADDQWFTAAVTEVTNGLTCGADAVPAQRLALSGPADEDSADLVLSGSMVRGWEGVAYAMEEINGVTYIVREQGGSTDRLVGPIRPGNGLTFRYLDDTGVQTNIPASVVRIEVTLRTLSNARNQSGALVMDSLTTSVNLRN